MRLHFTLKVGLLLISLTFLPMGILISNSMIVDSVDVAISQLKSDSAKIDKLIELSRSMLFQDVVLSNVYSKRLIELSTRTNNERGLAYGKFYLAESYSDYSFTTAEKFLLEAREHARKSKDAKLEFYINNSIGILFQNAGQHQKALDCFYNLLSEFGESDSLSAAFYNNIANSFKALNNDTLALENYMKAAAINEKYGNVQWLAINYLNIGSEFLINDQTEMALEYFNKSLDLVTQKNLTRLFPQIQMNLSRSYRKLDDYEKAIDHAHMALLTSKQSLNRFIEQEAYSILNELYFIKKNIDSMYYYGNQSNAIKDTLEKYTRIEELNSLEIKTKFEEEILRMELDGKLQEIEHKRNELIFIIVSISFILGLMVLLLLYFNQRNRIRNNLLEQKNLILEKEQLQHKLEFKNKELTTHLMYLQKNNEFLMSLLLEMQNLDKISEENLRHKIKGIIRDIERNAVSNVWGEFEKIFMEVHGDYYKSLTTRFPNLTPNELKLCAFLKLNLSTKEISAITFQTNDTLRIARHRLRTKLGLTRNDNIVTFLNQL